MCSSNLHADELCMVGVWVLYDREREGERESKGMAEFCNEQCGVSLPPVFSIHVAERLKSIELSTWL